MSSSHLQKQISLEYSIPLHFQSDLGKAKDALSQFITTHRYNKMISVVKKRTRKVACIFENTHHAHNISAVIRSMDAFGFLDLFFLYPNPDMKFRIGDTIDRGSSQWIFPRLSTQIARCATTLKKNGYLIALVSKPDFSRTQNNYASSLPAFSSSEFDTNEFLNFTENKKIALVFGTELYGVSEEWNDYADAYFSVEMNGFCESLNVSVCAAIILKSLRENFEKRGRLPLLNESERELVLEHWVTKEYNKSYEYIASKKPELLDWFLFVSSGKFYAEIK